MSECVVVQPIAEAGIRLLEEAGVTIHIADDRRIEALRPHLAQARAVITRDHGFSAEEIDAAPNLVAIVSHGTGVDSIDHEAAARRGITVAATPGTNAQAVAEHALGLIIACAKSVPAADRAVRAGDFDFRYHQTSVELGGRTLGLVGYGRIARRLAGFARALGMKVCAVSRFTDAGELARDGVTCAKDLDALCAEADVISLHALPSAGLLLDAPRLGRLKPGAIVVNTARGALIDEDALAAALKAGRIAAAGLDVFRTEPLPPDSPLLGCSNLVLTPHIGGAAREALDRTAMEAARKVLEALGRPARGGPG